MQEFLLKILLLNSNRRPKDGDIELIECVLKQCYLLSDELEDIRPSSVAFKNCFKWGGTIENSLSSAILTLNSKHGPFTECYDLIDKFLKNSWTDSLIYVSVELDNKKIIPGFGNPIIKDRDPRCEEINNIINKYNEVYWKMSWQIEDIFEEKLNKRIFSNLAFWCAASAHYLGLPRTHASLLPILAFSICYTNRTKKWA